MSNKNSFSNSHVWQRIMTFLLIFVMISGSQAFFLTGNAQARSNATTLHQPNDVTLQVESATDGTNIPEYKYIINIDNTGTTEQTSPADGCSPGSSGYPDSCNWVSVAGRANNSPILTQGDQSDFPLTMLPPDLGFSRRV